ncbi:response regulator transcription factor [Streptomyces sp. GC420]|uniref:response regulator transcription factor n=1 Tax=Streptomyces sp. GC420 TaxID=2697568 RepID=UPI0014152F03|nr:response regulator transcription factor [Streptomyces sp. GC420]NBM14231.1 response regulator [Streptomyces sp. GC420]
MISVAVCDDHGLIRSGIRRILEATSEFELVAAVATGDALMSALPNLRPDLLVLDIRLADVSGLDLLEKIAAVAPQTRVVVLSMHGAKGYVEKARALGARGYITKECLDEDLMSVLRAVIADEGFVSFRAAAPTASGAAQRRSADIDALSSRELEVLRLIAAGLTTGEVAEQLTVSPRTVESHRASIQRKLQVRTRAELARIALDEGLLD